ncbi:MAG TPA: Swt1 family HEPN domain-containing protein [Verrucomicrobiae bacterium]|nr:Swt1 family HEPN domain-containing protein [Verrucomicrobiae bacterium]
MPVPESNKACYAALYELETIVREFLLEELSRAYGSHWYRSRCDPGTLQRVERGMTGDRIARWPQGQLYHPVYYMNFSSYAALIETSAHWNDVFRNFFSRKDSITGLLRAIEPVRNKVAHNRVATEPELSTVANATTMLRECLGNAKCEALLARPARFWDINDALSRFERELTAALNALRTQTPILSEATDDLDSQWWFDELVMGDLYERLRHTLAMIEAYNNLPRSYGSAYTIEKWCADESFASAISSAISCIREYVRVLPKHGD